MYTLKVIRKFPQEEEVRIYNTVPFVVNEEEFFYCLEDEVIIQYHWEDHKEFYKSLLFGGFLLSIK